MSEIDLFGWGLLTGVLEAVILFIILGNLYEKR